MLECKATVRFPRFTPAMLRMLTILQELSTNAIAPQPLVITSANDSTHAKDSRHYTDEALDIRTHTFASTGATKRFATLLEQKLGPQFTVLFEDVGMPEEHLHIQVRRGLTYVPV